MELRERIKKIIKTNCKLKLGNSFCEVTDEIMHEIGTCGECAHCGHGGVCYMENGYMKESSEYCSDFMRSTNNKSANKPMKEE